jgi:hypothetical protein
MIRAGQRKGLPALALTTTVLVNPTCCGHDDNAERRKEVAHCRLIFRQRELDDSMTVIFVLGWIILLLIVVAILARFGPRRD